jgi:hypothetical protein
MESEHHVEKPNRFSTSSTEATSREEDSTPC